MINVENNETIPLSLAFPTVGRPSRTTHERRKELIEATQYIDEDKYNNRYKQADTKTTIAKVYHNKCCYCELFVRTSTGHIEHYRPKSIYWWLAYSWDNLLFICPTCNSTKGNKFEIIGEKASYDENSLNNIHTLRNTYNELEQPSLLHPECDAFEGIWIFQRNGKMDSNVYRGQYTIKTLELDALDLRDKRAEIIDDVEEEIRDLWVLYQNDMNELENQLIRLIKRFIKHSDNPRKEFIAFRKYFIQNLLTDFIAEICM